MAPGDRYEVKPEHAHLPLVVMLVLTQLSVGAFCTATILRLFFPSALIRELTPFHSLVRSIARLSWRLARVRCTWEGHWRRGARLSG